MRRTMLQELTYEPFQQKFENRNLQDKLEQVTSQHHHVLKQC